MDQKKSLLAGAILGGLGVALGAFGAHALKDMLIKIYAVRLNPSFLLSISTVNFLITPRLFSFFILLFTVVTGIIVFLDIL